MTYFLSGDYYDEEHYRSIGHTRRIEFNPQGRVRWKCGCGAKGGWGTDPERKKDDFHRHVHRLSLKVER